MPEQTEPVVLVHPDDVNVADAKARAAELGATVVGNKWMPRGCMFVVAAGTLDFLPRRQGERGSGAW